MVGASNGQNVPLHLIPVGMLAKYRIEATVAATSKHMFGPVDH